MLLLIPACFAQGTDAGRKYVKEATEWQAGKAGRVRVVPDEKPQKILSVIDIQTGRIA
jgi:hypothetical protein